MRIKLLVFAMLVLCWGAFSHQAFAQTISCASQDGGRQFCPADTRGGVTMVRQNSSSPCVQGQTWGYDGRGIWVDRGCRADFQAGNSYPGGPGPGGPGPGPGGNTITCESSHNRRNYCTIGNVNSNVEMVQQLSQAPCTRGATWGNDGQGIWVDRGCRATFRVSAYGYTGPGWWNSGPGRPPTNQPRNGACFFRQTNYSDDYFCMERGASFGFLPGGFNDQISSIKIHGGATVVAFSDGNFSGGSVVFRHNVPDLRNYHVQGTGNKDWNNRISSIRIN
jgi:hypothetical protein